MGTQYNEFADYQGMDRNKAGEIVIAHAEGSRATKFIDGDLESMFKIEPNDTIDEVRQKLSAALVKLNYLDPKSISISTDLKNILDFLDK